MNDQQFGIFRETELTGNINLGRHGKTDQQAYCYEAVFVNFPMYLVSSFHEIGINKY